MLRINGIEPDGLARVSIIFTLQYFRELAIKPRTSTDKSCKSHNTLYSLIIADLFDDVKPLIGHMYVSVRYSASVLYKISI